MASLTGAGWQGPGVPFGVLEVFTSGFLVLTGMPWGCLPRSHGTRETLERLWVQLPVGGWEESGVHLFPKPGVSAVFGAEKWGPWGGESALDSARELTWERMVAERRRMAAWPPKRRTWIRMLLMWHSSGEPMSPATFKLLHTWLPNFLGT